MSVYDYLPTYHQVENNNLKGIQPGFVVAQMGVATTTGWVGGRNLHIASGAKIADSGMFENGEICAITADGIVPAASDSKVLYLHFSEPLNTVYNAAKFFACNLKEEDPRLVQLIPGDEWMSDMPVPTALSSRIIEVTSAVGQYEQNSDWYKVDELPDDTKAKHYMFLG